jgi:hypothetical protein
MKRSTKKEIKQILNRAVKGEMIQFKMLSKKEKNYIEYIEETGLAEAIKQVQHERRYTITEALKLL